MITVEIEHKGYTFNLPVSIASDLQYAMGWTDAQVTAEIERILDLCWTSARELTSRRQQITKTLCSITVPIALFAPVYQEKEKHDHSYTS